MASPQRPSASPLSSSSSEHEERDQDQSSDHDEHQTSFPEQPTSSSSQHPSPPTDRPIQHKFKRATPQPKAKIITHLESLLHEIETAFTTTNFNPTLPPWSTHFSPTFTAEVGMLANSPSKKKIPLSEFLTLTSQRVEQNPEYRLRVVGMSTNVNTRRGKAESFVNLEMEGVPVGIVRPSVASVGFECVEGEWRVVRWGNFRGVGGFE